MGDFKDLCLNFLETMNSYDNKYLLKEFDKIYKNRGEYKFLGDNKKMLKIMRTWKRNSLKFTKFSIFEKNILNKENEIFCVNICFFIVSTNQN